MVAPGTQERAGQSDRWRDGRWRLDGWAFWSCLGATSRHDAADGADGRTEQRAEAKREEVNRGATASRSSTTRSAIRSATRFCAGWRHALPPVSSSSSTSARSTSPWRLEQLVGYDGLLSGRPLKYSAYS